MKYIHVYIIGLLLFQSCQEDEKVKTINFSNVDFSFLEDTTKNLSSIDEMENLHEAKNKNLGILSISNEGNYQLKEQTFFYTKSSSKIELNLELHEVNDFPYEIIKFNKIQHSDTSYQVVKEYKYYPSNLLTIHNISEDTIGMDQIDDRLYLLYEAKNEMGEWQSIEYFDYSKCGNSYWKTSFPPNQLILVQIPKFMGDFETDIRVKLKINTQLFYSNSIKSKIKMSQLCFSNESSNYQRLIRKFGKSKTDSLVYLL